MSDHLYITFNINTGRLLSNIKKYNRIAWSLFKFNIDSFQAALEWEYSKKDIEKYQDLPAEISGRMDEILRIACDLAMPRRSNKFRQIKTMYWWNEEIKEKKRMYPIKKRMDEI